MLDFYQDHSLHYKNHVTWSKWARLCCRVLIFSQIFSAWRIGPSWWLGPIPGNGEETHLPWSMWLPEIRVLSTKKKEEAVVGQHSTMSAAKRMSTGREYLIDICSYYKWDICVVRKKEHCIFSLFFSNIHIVIGHMFSSEPLISFSFVLPYLYRLQSSAS